MDPQVTMINNVINQTLSHVKSDRDAGKYMAHPAAAHFFANLKLDGQTTSGMLDYISNSSVPDNHSLQAAIQLKNILKKIYGSTMSYQSYNDQAQKDQEEDVDRLDEQGKTVLK